MRRSPTFGTALAALALLLPAAALAQRTGFSPESPPAAERP